MTSIPTCVSVPMARHGQKAGFSVDEVTDNLKENWHNQNLNMADMRLLQENFGICHF